ncbi:MAG: hypothetical protein IJN03_01380 [Bacilli bacterium]|nr:hypothetical protein [Bacilli bacterium]
MYNKNNFPPSIDPQLYSISAVIIGAAIVDDFTAYEQNAIGNWLMLLAQYIITHAAQQNLLDMRFNNSKNQTNVNNDINYLLAAINKISAELEKIKNEN